MVAKHKRHSKDMQMKGSEFNFKIFHNSVKQSSYRRIFAPGKSTVRGAPLCSGFSLPLEETPLLGEMLSEAKQRGLPSPARKRCHRR